MYQDKTVKPIKNVKGKTDLEQALEDVEKGNLIHCGSYEEYLKKTAKFRD